MSPELNEFPTIQGNTLNKEKKLVPDDFVDKNLVVIVAFQQWHQALVDESILLLEQNGLGETHNIIEVPTIRKSSKLNEIYLDGIMRAGIRDNRIRNPNEDTIYWFLVAKDSKNIIARGYGVISEDELDLINSF